jgi:hypothetical protein
MQQATLWDDSVFQLTPTIQLDRLIPDDWQACSGEAFPNLDRLSRSLVCRVKDEFSLPLPSDALQDCVSMALRALCPADDPSGLACLSDGGRLPLRQLLLSRLSQMSLSQAEGTAVRSLIEALTKSLIEMGESPDWRCLNDVPPYSSNPVLHFHLVTCDSAAYSLCGAQLHAGVMGKSLDVCQRQPDWEKSSKALSNFLGPARDILNHLEIPSGVRTAADWGFEDLERALRAAEVADQRPRQDGTRDRRVGCFLTLWNWPDGARDYAEHHVPGRADESPREKGEPSRLASMARGTHR